MIRMNRCSAALTCAAALALAGHAARSQQAPAPVLSQSFEENDGGWQASPGSSAIVSVTHDAALVKNGKGALKYSYSLTRGEFNVLLLPLPDMPLANARSLKFWIRCDHVAPVAVILQEKEGGRYTAVFTAPKDGWQEVELSVDDFVLNQNANDPKDPDGKLDIDRVENVGFVDIAQFFVQGDPAIASLFGVSAGPRQLLIDDFTINRAVVPASSAVKGGEGPLDTFAHPQLSWMAAGTVDLSRASGKPLEGRGMQAKYRQMPGKIAGFSHFVPAASLAGAAKLAFSVASAKPARLIVQVEEKSGGKYNAVIELPGNSGRADLNLSFADFKAADDSKDDNNKLDLDQVTQIIFLDGSGILDQADAENTLWINNIRVTR